MTPTAFRENARLAVLLVLLVLVAAVYLATAPLRRRPSPHSQVRPISTLASPSVTTEAVSQSLMKAQIKSLLAQPPTSLDGMLRLGYLYAQTGQFLLAAQEVERAAHRYPHSARPFLALGQLLQSGDFQDRAMEAYRRAEQVEPRNWQPVVQIALMETDLGWQLAAIQDAKKAVRLSVREPAPVIALARAYFQAALWTQADQATRQALTLAPDDPKLWLLLGQVDSYYGMILYSPAMAALQKSLALGGPNPQLLQALGDLELKWSRPGHLERAEKYYRQAITMAPDSQNAIVGLASCESQTGRIQEAVRLLEPLLRKPAKDQPPGVPLKLGQLLIREGQTARGQAMILAYQKRLKPSDDRASIRVAMAPSEPSAHYQEGVSLIRHRHIGYGVLELRMALQLDPHNRTYRNTLISALVVQGRRADAARILRGKPLVDVTELTPL